MAKHGKNYRAAQTQLKGIETYEPKAAIDELKKLATAKFDETFELHMRMGVDPRHADQMVRGVVVMPRGMGKTVRILVFADGEAADAAREAGADHVGLDDLIAQIQGGWLEFDMAIAIPSAMGKVGRLGRVLGPRGLMPSPKSGTIVQPGEIKRVIDEARKGRVEYRVDKTANIHLSFGKRSFETEALIENLGAAMDSVLRNKPATSKGSYIKKAFLTTTMSPSVRVDVNALSSLRSLA
ncbi:MAG: 50S ribosomal protein L1 [Caldilineales bacterium]|nr:50S ribosomal protein L1 [Caldilineales bacterium]